MSNIQALTNQLGVTIDAMFITTYHQLVAQLVSAGLEDGYQLHPPEAWQRLRQVWHTTYNRGWRGPRGVVIGKHPTGFICLAANNALTDDVFFTSEQHPQPDADIEDIGSFQTMIHSLLPEDERPLLRVPSGGPCKSCGNGLYRVECRLCTGPCKVVAHTLEEAELAGSCDVCCHPCRVQPSPKGPVFSCLTCGHAMLDCSCQATPVDPMELLIERVVRRWKQAEAVDIAPGQEDAFMDELKRAAKQAQSPDELLRTLAVTVHESDTVDEYYASPKELIILARGAKPTPPAPPPPLSLVDASDLVDPSTPDE